MHSPINAVNELPLLTYDAKLLCDQEHTDGAVLTPGHAGGEGRWGPGRSRWHRGTSQDGTLRMGTVREVGCECARTRACSWGCACVRARDSVC